MLTIYSILYSIALIFVFPFEYRKRPPEMRKRWLSEKLGKAGPPAGKQGRTLWLHAVSVGEVIAAVPFLRSLKERRPCLRVIVSTITDTGRKVAGERLGDAVEVVYLPFDLVFILKRAVRRMRPSLFVVMETELWPNMLRAMKAEGVPTGMLNGRISKGSFRGYRKIRPLIKRMLSYVDFFCMQDALYAERIIELGGDAKKVNNTGNFKFDIKVKDEEISWSRSLGGPVVIAGSTHRGEEGLMVSVFKKLREDIPDVIMIIAPRHPERFGEVEELLKVEGVPYIRRTRIREDDRISGAVVLLDTVGELTSVYGISDVAVMGGSFIRHGGQNPLEPAYFGKPVVCGQHMGNFPFISEFYENGAAVEVDEEGLYETVKELAASARKREAIGGRAREILVRNRGAVERAVKVVEEYLGKD